MEFFAIFAVIFVVFAALAAAAPQDGEYGTMEDEDEYSDDGEMDQSEVEWEGFGQSFEKG